MQLMLQATVCDGDAFDAPAFCDDLFGSAKVDVGRCDIVDAFMIAGIVIVIDEGIDLAFEIAGQIVVVEQNAVLQGLVPAFDFSLGLRMIRRAADMLHVLVLEPRRQISCNIGCTIVAEQSWPLRDGDVIEPDAASA